MVCNPSCYPLGLGILVTVSTPICEPRIGLDPSLWDLKGTGLRFFPFVPNKETRLRESRASPRHPSTGSSTARIQDPIQCVYHFIRDSQGHIKSFLSFLEEVFLGSCILILMCFRKAAQLPKIQSGIFRILLFRTVVYM